MEMFFGFLHFAGAFVVFCIVMTVAEFMSIASSNKTVDNMALEVERATGYKRADFDAADVENNEAFDAMMQFALEYFSSTKWQNRISDLFGLVLSGTIVLLLLASWALPFAAVYYSGNSYLFWLMPVFATVSVLLRILIGYTCYLITGRNPNAAKNARKAFENRAAST